MSRPAGASERTTDPSSLRLIVLILEGYVYLALIAAIFVAATGVLVWACWRAGR